MKIELITPTEAQIKEAYEKILEFYKSQKSNETKVLVKFSKPTNIYIRKKLKECEQIELKFFDSQQGNFCYTVNKRTGYPLYNIEYNNIISIESILKVEDIEVFKIDDAETTLKREKQIKSIIKSKHPNLWNDINEEWIRKSYCGLEKKSITSIFPDYVLERIKDAIENKKDFYWKEYGKKRDYSVRVTFENGNGRAWFSSEYSGCGNGDYYVLINPTTATLHERD